MEYEPVTVDGVTYIAVSDERDNTPMLIIEQVGQEVIQVTHADDPNFKFILRRLGMLGAVPGEPDMVVALHDKH